MRYRRITYLFSEGSTGRGAGWISDTFARFSPPVAAPWFRPPADVCETRTGLIVRVELAGVRDEDVEVTLHPDALVVEGVRRCACDADARFHAAEIRYGPFRLAMRLPAWVDGERVTARNERGVLEVVLPRSGEEHR